MHCPRCRNSSSTLPVCATCAQIQFNVAIQPSPLHGLGLFACAQIPAGSLIVPYTGEIMNELDACARYAKGDEYLVAGPDNLFYICGRLSNGAISLGARANHSATPNAQLEFVELDDQLDQAHFAPIWIRALTTIPRHREILVDYGDRFPTDNFST